MIKRAFLGLLRFFVRFNEDQKFRGTIWTWVGTAAFFSGLPALVTLMCTLSWQKTLVGGLAIPALMLVIVLVTSAWDVALESSKAILAKEKLLADHPELRASKGAVSIPLETVRASRGALSDPDSDKCWGTATVDTSKR